MTLTPQQIIRISEAIDQQWNLPRLEVLAAELDINLNNLALGGSVEQRARKFVEHINNLRPPRDRELLQKLSVQANAALQRLADDLLKLTYISPTGLALDAIVLGKTAFVNRADLRTAIRDFMFPSPFTTRVVIVRGKQPGGKSYSWYLLQHLAFQTGAKAILLRLKDTGFTPREIFLNVGLCLRLDTSILPPMADDPQQSRVYPLANWLKGQIVAMQSQYWLVIDDLNDQSVTKSMREAALAIASAVEETKPDLWLALLGYNDPITDTYLQFIAQEDAKFPDIEQLADHFEFIAKSSSNALTRSKALDYASTILGNCAELDREYMMKMNRRIQRLGEELKEGRQP